MAKFCGKCGSPIDEKTGLCPNCDKKTLSTGNNSNANKNSKIKENKLSNQRETGRRKKKKNKSKKVVIAMIAGLLIIVAVGTAIGSLVYNEKLDIPYVNNIFISLGIKNKSSTTDNNDDNNPQGDNSKDTATTSNEEVDLSNNYEVPEFDAEEYFKENTTLKSAFDAGHSENISTEAEAFDNFIERGFEGYQVTYEYSIDGTYLGTNEISQYSLSEHPMYQTYYTTASGDIWTILEINGSFFATPITYNFSHEKSASVMISETDTITSYDSSTNKFYENIPNESQSIIKTVSRIDAETIEKLNSEGIDKQ